MAALVLPNSLPEELAARTFLRFLRAAPRPAAGGAPLAYRLAYVHDLLVELARHGLAAPDAAAAAFGGARPPPAPADVPAAAARAAILTVEAATRAQSESDLWTLLRRGLATASTVRWGADGPRFPPTWCEASTARCGTPDNAALIFGRVNERVARAAVAALYAEAPTPDLPAAATGGDEGDGDGAKEEMFTFDETGAPPPGHDLFSCGLLLDPRTGMVGASLDLLVCDRDARGRLAPHRTQTEMLFFEIKCRAKYLFSADDASPTARAYARLLGRPDADTLRGFLNSIARPGVEFFEGAPGPGEALATADPAWRRAGAEDAPATRRRCGAFDARHVAANAHAQSEVWLFSDPVDGRQDIVPWASGERALRVPVFANPRHANFRQILVQSYVVAGVFPDRPARPHLATFFGRRRRPCEQNRTLDLASLCDVPPACAVPVLLIVTPVSVCEGAFEDLRTRAEEAFRATASRTWDSAAADSPATAS
nr:alkaline nuclease [Suid alphaherpesvirus 1]